MFEKFWGGNKNEGKNVQRLNEIAEKEFKNEVNGSTIFLAFQAMKNFNDRESLGLTDEELLKKLRGSARFMASSVDDLSQGGAERLYQEIENEIEQLRERLSEKRSEE